MARGVRVSPNRPQDAARGGNTFQSSSVSAFMFDFPNLGSIVKCLRACGSPGLLLCGVCNAVMVVEHAIHDGCAAADRGHDHVPVDGLGDMGGLVANGVADLLERQSVATHDRDGRVPTLVGVPVPILARLVILLNRQLSASLLYWRPSS